MGFASLGNASFHVPQRARARRRAALAMAGLFWATAILFATMSSWTPAAFAAVVALLPTAFLVRDQRPRRGPE